MHYWFRLRLIGFLVLIGAVALPGHAVMIGPGEVADLPLPTAQAGDAAYEEGIRRLAAGSLDGAEQAFRAALEQRRDHANAMLGLAEVEFRRNRIDAAGKLIQEAVQLQPSNSHAHTSLGRYLLLQRRYPEAEMALLRAIDLNPRLFRPRIDLADLYATILERPDEALKAYEAATGIDPEHAGAHYGLGMLLARQGITEGAEAMLARAMQLAPENPLPSIALAQLHAGQGEFRTALERIDHALGLQPNNVQAGLLRADILQVLANTTEALDQLLQLADTYPSNSEIQLRLGMLHQTEDRSAGAEAAYLRALEIDPDLALAYNNLAWMAAENRSNLPQAEQWARKAVELAPRVPAFHDTLGWVYRAMGRLTDAERVLSHASSMEPQSAKIHYHLGRVHLDQDRHDDAEVAFRKAVALEPDFAPALRALEQLEVR